MSKSPRALQQLMTAVDAGHAVDDGNVVDSASSGSSKLLAPPRRRSTYNNGRGGAGVRKTAPPAVAVLIEASSNASFEFSAAVGNNNYSSASPASMVFSDGQLRAHQFPAVRSSGAGGSNQPAPALSPVRTSSIGSYSTKQQAAGVTAGSRKRVSFATDGGPDKAGGGQGKKSGGLLGCCRSSSRNQAVEPVARNGNRKVEAF